MQKNKAYVAIMKDSVVAGAASGVTTRLVTTPLDVIKIRFQLQLEPTIRLKVRFSPRKL